MSDWEIAPIDEIVSTVRDRARAEARTAAGSVASATQCPECRADCIKSWNDYNLVCPACDRLFPLPTGDSYAQESGDHHNVSSNAYMPFKPVGTNNRAFRSTLIKYTSSSAPYRNAQVTNLLKQYNFINRDFKIPQNVITEAVDMFVKLQDVEYLRRGRTRRGVLGACLGAACADAGITKTKTQLAQMMQVEESHINEGMSELEHYSTMGVVSIKTNRDPTSDYINSYFEMFDIPAQHKRFVLALIEAMLTKRIDAATRCQNTTRCIGTVMFLNKLLNLGITHDQVSANCEKISRGTYLNIVGAITSNEKALRGVFVKYKMPVPAGWEPVKTA